MPRATKEQSEETAARVLAVAQELFATRGYADVALDDVAATAGVTRGAVYHHYASKQGLFAAVHDRAQTAVAESVIEVIQSITDPWQALEGGCDAFLAACQQPGIRQIMLVDATTVLGWDAWRAADDANSGRLLKTVLQALNDADVIVVTDLGATHALLSGAMNEAALWIAGSPDQKTALAAAQADLRRLLAGLRKDR